MMIDFQLSISMLEENPRRRKTRGKKSRLFREIVVDILVMFIRTHEKENNKEREREKERKSLVKE